MNSTSAPSQQNWSTARINVDPGAIYREALRQTDIIMESVRNWFDELPTPLDDRGSHADGGILRMKSSRSRSGTMAKIVWGSQARSMLADMELRVVERMAAWLIQDRGAPVDVVGALAQRRIEEALPKRIHLLINQNATPDFLSNLGRTVRDLERFRPETTTNDSGEDPNQSIEWGQKVTEAEAEIHARTNNPNDWTAFVLTAINRGLRNADIFLTAMDQGVRCGVTQDGPETDIAERGAAKTGMDRELDVAAEVPNASQLGQESQMEQARSAGVLPVAIPVQTPRAPDYSRGPETSMSMRMRNGCG